MTPRINIYTNVLMNLCQYKDIFGKPNEGVHKYRLFDFAIVDVAATIIVGYIISKYYKYNLFYVLCVLFTLGTFFHILFCVNTKMLKIFNINGK